MKVATILPQNYLHLTKNDDYFMCLGNFIDAPGMEKYTEFFKARAAEGKYVIMDNGLIEGDQRPITELAKKAMKLGASELIVTDIFCDKEKTLKAIRRDLEELQTAKHPQLMLVPQGNSLEEWAECAHEILYNSYNIYTIGVPKVLTKLGGRDGRIKAILRLMEKCPMARHTTFHLLGCWQTPLEITMLDKLSLQGNFPNIRGVDSAMPFVYARAGKGITTQDRPDSEPINFEKTKVSSRLLKRNIKKWREAASAKSVQLLPCFDI